MNPGHQKLQGKTFELFNIWVARETLQNASQDIILLILYGRDTNEKECGDRNTMIFPPKKAFWYIYSKNVFKRQIK